MTVEQYLDQCRTLDAQIDNLIYDKDELKSRLLSTGIDYAKPRVQVSHASDMMSTVYAQIDEKERKITEQIDALVDLRMTITDQINALDDHRFTRLLHMKYVEYKEAPVIGPALGVSTDYVYKLHPQALKAFHERWGDVLQLDG